MHGWCCAGHSIWTKTDNGPGPTAQRAATGLVSWRDWIVELSALFARFDPNLPPVEAFERHAIEVLDRVTARTGAADAWYTHAAQVLRWFLESQGHGSSSASIVAAATRGRFESWVALAERDARDVVWEMRDRTFRRRRDHVEGISLWTSARAATLWLPASAYEPPAERIGDGVLDYTIGHDAAIDEARGARMLDALNAVREQARGTAPLSYASFEAWHSLAVGDTVERGLRVHDAWAKDGRERYERVRDLPKRIEQALRDAEDPQLAAVARAARVYVDVGFLHPFADGNARAARLVLDFVLTRAGLAVCDPEGALFRFPLPVTDPQIGARYQALLARLTFRAAR